MPSYDIPVSRGIHTGIVEAHTWSCTYQGWRLDITLRKWSDAFLTSGADLNLEIIVRTSLLWPKGYWFLFIFYFSLKVNFGIDSCCIENLCIYTNWDKALLFGSCAPESKLTWTAQLRWCDILISRMDSDSIKLHEQVIFISFIDTCFFQYFITQT